jgi:hypothetical protein
MAKQKESKPIYVSNKNDPRLKAYQDSLYVRTQSSQKFSPGSKTRPLTQKEKSFWKDEKTGLEPNVVEYTKGGKNDSGYFGHFKKPTQPVIYQERTYQKESDPIKSKSIKGVDAKLPDLKKVEGPSKWMRSFGAGASENYWSKVDASGKPLPGSIAPNKNAVEQPAGPGEDYQVRNSIPLGTTQFNKEKK